MIFRTAQQIQCSSALVHSITEALSSAFDSGAQSPFLFSVVGYYCMGYTVGLRVREGLGNMDRVRGSRQGLRPRFKVDPKLLGQS